jgi:hypothetical protein
MASNAAICSETKGSMNNTPKRIHRRRSKGWRMPGGAIYVGRPTIWGNPFLVSDYGQQKAVDLFRDWLNGLDPETRPEQRKRLLESIQELRGKDLVCWCRPDQPCHADVLLELANKPKS